MQQRIQNHIDRYGNEGLDLSPHFNDSFDLSSHFSDSPDLSPSMAATEEATNTEEEMIEPKTEKIFDIGNALP